jgi:hypothetical protein
MTLSLTRLGATLEAVAKRTWTDLRDGQQLGVSQGETGITDRALLQLRREHPDLLVRNMLVQKKCGRAPIGNGGLALKDYGRACFFKPNGSIMMAIIVD